MPESPPWWEVFGVSWTDLLDAVRTILGSYSQPRPLYVALGRDLTLRREGEVASPVVVALSLEAPAAAASAADRTEDKGTNGKVCLGGEGLVALSSVF